MKLYCLGCGEVVISEYHGESLCLTHFCNATVFRLEDKNLLIPASFYRAQIEKKTIPHIDYYVGNSLYTDEYKKAFIQLLKKLGAIWSKDCEVCQKRKRGCE